MSTKNEIVLSKKFESKNNEVRAYYLEKLETDRNLSIKINELVEIVHQEHKDWSLTKIAQYICSVNEDLDNFSSKTVERHISQENRILLHVDDKPTSTQNRKKKKEDEEETKLQNNVTEPSFDTCRTNVLEESSISSPNIHTDYFKDAETAIEGGGAVFQSESIDDDDNGTAIVHDPDYVKRLEQENEELKKIFRAPVTYEGKTQDLPLIIHVDPANKKILKAELDKKKAKEIGRF